MKKPSEWTPQEAWANALDAARIRAQHSNNFEIPFPADPPEVVAETMLRDALPAFRSYVDGSGRVAFLAITELLARREAERKS